MKDATLIVITDANVSLVDDLVEDPERDGYHFIERTITDWHSGKNKFSGPGENLWGLISGSTLIAIGGLNQDPYTEDMKVGRVRHLYVASAHRRQGCASSLMNHILHQGPLHFKRLRLFTDNPGAGEFYKKMGFAEIASPKASHQLIF
ncbi:GNAT family N-acetyltransferase [Mucilaginibacter sp. HD30]